MDVEVVIIICSLILSAFFSGMEIAYVSSNKIHIEIEKKQNSFISKILARLTKKPSKFIATMLVGNNIALVVYGFFMGDLLVNWLGSYLPVENNILHYLVTDGLIFTQTLISTLVILMTAEFLPKVFFQIYANTFLKIFALPAYFFYILFSFISSFIIWVSDMVLKLFFKTKGDEVQLAFSKVELGNYINEQMDGAQETEKIDSEIQIFKNALEFFDIKAREVMIPRTEIIAVNLNETPENLTKIFTQTGLSKILVFKETNDDIIGYVHSFDLFKKPKDIRSMMHSVVYVPETMLINKVLDLLTKKRRSIAVVIDEYGGTSGMMTVEDIVEELFGEIEDEHDSEAYIEEKMSENTFKFSARLEVDYINDTYKLDLPEGDHYETLSGMIVHHTEEIPEKDGLVYIENYKIQILEVSSSKIELVQVQKIKD
ncbi:hemolysin family protein [Mesonia sp. K7]|uniref:hemolysin family protein n=1 Tax=Mesonia sp. K7 TaxID=2218606 RepID=UPI000DA9FA74|nr:hemolysin family protein [Mesonia sp. K7]PZD77776.1 hemolysin [Mesonia sp. K7]